MNAKSTNAATTARSGNPRASRMDPQARRRHLIAAALRTFAARGIGEASHSAIAREAGVAVPTAFHYFESKEALVEAVLDEVSRFLLDDLLAGNDDPAESAPNVIANIGALAGMREIIERGQRDGSIRADIDIDDAARVIVALAHMTVQMKFSGATREQVEHTLRSLMQGYLQTV